MENEEINEVLGTDSDYAEDSPQPAKKGTYTKPMIIQNLTESFDNFRMGMDKLVGVYDLIGTTDIELYRKIARFGEAMTKIMEGYAKLIQQQGGSVDSITKSEGIQKYFGQQGMSALGMNENKKEVFDARVDLNIGRIKSIMVNSKR